MHFGSRFLLVFLACWCTHFSAQAARVFEDNMAQRMLACTGCHGAQGQAGPDGYYPRLAGKPAGYLYSQLQNFRDGRRHYPLMTGLLDNLSDAYLRDIAAHFASQSAPYPPPKASSANAATLELGRQLVQDGRTGQGLPACVQCHGRALMGVNPNVPGLLGLPSDYLSAQIGGWQTGQRHASAPDCMAKIARMLTPTDISALAQWLSSQPVPPGARAAPSQLASPQTTKDWACGGPAGATGGVTAAVTASDRKAPSVPSAATAQVAHGQYLARIGNCAHCHTARGAAAYAGARAIDTPFGAVLSSNLTPDPTHGIGRWTAQDFWQALHHGISKDGRALYPAFPYTSYTHLSRSDSDALFAYLRTVPASATPRAPHALRWPYSSALALGAWRALYFKPATEQPSAAIQAPNPAASATDGAALARGAYLVNGLGHCMECHAARNALGAASTEIGSGGSVLPGGQWFAPSLADVAQASVADWSVEEVATFLTTGVNARAVASGPMAEVVLHGTQHLSPADARAMAMYLKTLPRAPAAKAADSAAASSKTLQQGERIYETHCADCHGLTGAGRAGAYPALAGNRAVTQLPPNNLINTVLHGGFAPATSSNPRPFGMPPYLLQLADGDIAAVLSYIRSAWGNRAPGVSEFDINKFRRSQAP